MKREIIEHNNNFGGSDKNEEQDYSETEIDFQQKSKSDRSEWNNKNTFQIKNQAAAYQK